VVDRRTIFQRIYLTLVVGGQVILAPIIAFSVTYLVDIDTDAYTVSLRMELLPWIVSAAVGYGVISLMLALIVGGWIPRRVADAGGWSAALGFSHRLRDPELVDRTRTRLRRGPFGRLGRLVHTEVHEKGRELLEIHGGLQILASPLQVGLVLIPTMLMLITPKDLIIDGRLLEFGLFGYLFALAIALRLFPLYAPRLVVAASRLRRAIARVTRFSWMAPVLLLWLLVRLSIAIAFEQLGIDVDNWREFGVEKRLLETLLPVTIAVPESSFLDLLVALSILPVATFTTLVTVLGGGAVVPRWMIDGEDVLEDLDERPTMVVDTGEGRPMRWSELTSDAPADGMVDADAGLDRSATGSDSDSVTDHIEGSDVQGEASSDSGDDGSESNGALDGSTVAADDAGLADSPFAFPAGALSDDENGDGTFNMPGLSGWVAAKLTDRIEPRLRRTRRSDDRR